LNAIARQKETDNKTHVEWAKDKMKQR